MSLVFSVRITVPAHLRHHASGQPVVNGAEQPATPRDGPRRGVDPHATPVHHGLHVKDVRAVPAGAAGCYTVRRIEHHTAECPREQRPLSNPQSGAVRCAVRGNAFTRHARLPCEPRGCSTDRPAPPPESALSPRRARRPAHTTPMYAAAGCEQVFIRGRARDRNARTHDGAQTNPSARRSRATRGTS